MSGRGAMYAKMAAVFVTFAIGGPALMYYVTPTEGEVFNRFNPELQKRNLELRDKRISDHQEFLAQLKEHSKSDKNMWLAEKEARASARQELDRARAAENAATQSMREQMRAEARGS